MPFNYGANKISGFSDEISSNNNEQLNVSAFDVQTWSSANVTWLGELKTVIPVRLAGTAFSNGTKDPNFWTETVTGTGSVTQSWEIILATGVTADSTAQYQTVRKARKISWTTNQFRALARNIQEPTADCIRRIWAYNDNDGYFAQYDWTTFWFVNRKDWVDTVIENGSFNWNAGATVDADGTAFSKVIIEYSAISAKLFINGTLIHTIVATTESLTNSLDLQVTIELINENGNIIDNSYEVLFATILRLGELESENQYKYIQTNTTTVCKYGAWRLERIIIPDNSGDLYIYDWVDATGILMCEIDTSQGSEPLGSIEFGMPYNDWLTIVSTWWVKATIIYE